MTSSAQHPNHVFRARLRKISQWLRRMGIQDASDVVQDRLVEILQRDAVGGQPERGVASFSTARIRKFARERGIDRIRQTRRREALLEQVLWISSDATAFVSHDEILSRLDRVLNQYLDRSGDPDSGRSVQMYCRTHFGEMTQREVAEDLGISLRELQKRVSKVRSFIRVHL